MPQNEGTEVIFSGDVQGVGFRYTAARIARGFAVTGYVRNLRDGRVEMVAEGTPDELDAFVESVAREMGRHIRSMNRLKRPATGKYAAFSIAR